ncbi:geranylgeranyl reductase family protein [Salinifilum aidingensis]
MSQRPSPDFWDVVVVGAGPAGTSAARAAAGRGCAVLLLERDGIPRYKTCGGGLVGGSLEALSPGTELNIYDEVRRVTLSMNGKSPKTLPSRPPWAKMVFRDEFDAALVEEAARAGVSVRDGTAVKGVELGGGEVRLRLSGGDQVRAGAVVGADGSASRIAKFVGVQCRQVDLALEAEVPVDGATEKAWSGRALLEWGPLPGSFGWVFPKGDICTVGVVGSRGSPDATRGYMREFLDRHHFADIEPVRNTGHLTRCRFTESPLARGPVLVAGDAAGLADPWLREGISFALRSGKMAGRAAASLAGSAREADVRTEGERYHREVDSELGAEMRASERLARIFTRHPALVHTALTRFPLVWRRVDDYLTGRATIPEVLNSPLFKPAVAAMSAVS